MFASPAEALCDAWCKLSAREVLLRAHEEFGDGLVVVCALRRDTLPLLHLISSTIPETPVVFSGTLGSAPGRAALREEIVRRLSLHVLDEAPEAARASARAWISGGRRKAGLGRSCDDLVETDEDGKIRINPLVAWTEADLRLFSALNDLEGVPAGA